MYLCHECRSEVDPLHPEVVYAAPLRTVNTFLGTEYREGPGVYFHPDCVPRAREEFRVKAKPGDARVAAALQAEVWRRHGEGPVTMW